MKPFITSKLLLRREPRSGNKSKISKNVLFAVLSQAFVLDFRLICRSCELSLAAYRFDNLFLKINEHVTLRVVPNRSLLLLIPIQVSHISFL